MTCELSSLVAIYVKIDDAVKTLAIKGNHGNEKISDSEILFIIIVGSLYHRINFSETIRAYFGVGKLFSNSIDASTFSRRSRNLIPLVEQLHKCLNIDLLLNSSNDLIIDSMPLPICHLQRQFQTPKLEATLGYCSSKNEHYFGFKVHVLSSGNAGVIGHVLLPANQHDLRAVEALCGMLPQGRCVLADKAYNSENREREILEKHGVTLLPIRKRNSKHPENQPQIQLTKLTRYKDNTYLITL